ncbi:uncharacterized protein SOCE26_083410 [Sorangium cellulosum]|uniref:Uncharacterized protein n=1 Tax=Sorangium cellulosum TaxID=56 RepID=A0A2L0F5L9_SORCE|nr:uncharacterized protein SOCE26_083410 [Sorangium cellulosum]
MTTDRTPSDSMAPTRARRSSPVPWELAVTEPSPLRVVDACRSAPEASGIFFRPRRCSSSARAAWRRRCRSARSARWN